MQTRRRSLYEASLNNVIAFIYALGLNYGLLQYKWASIESCAFWITVWFTLASLIRQFIMRRFFEWLDRAYPT